MHLLGTSNLEYLLAIVGKVATCLVTEICRGFAVACNLDRVIDTHSTVIGSYHYGMTSLGEHLQQGKEFGVFKPRTRKRAERGVIFGELADNLGLGAGVRENIQKVIDDNREIGIVDVLDIVDKFSSRLGAHKFVE